MRKLVKVFSVIIICSLFTMGLCRVNHPEGVIPVHESSKELQIKADLPFNITTNADFDLYDSGGNGQPSTPWILENYVINASGLGVHGILINNTDAYFILRNCTVINASVGYDGIRLENVTNGKITNTTVARNDWGIALAYSNYNVLTNITAHDNTIFGIYLGGAHNNVVTNNTVYENSEGIYLSGASNNTVTDNIAFNNTYGIQLIWPNTNNTLARNTANHNTYGIYLHRNSDSNRVTNNTANYNTGHGICLDHFCDGNNLTGNTANDNTQYGIYLYDFCYSNTFTNNTANNNTQYGIRVEYDSDQNDFIDNEVTYNGDYGVRVGPAVMVITCDNNYFYHNSILQNKDGLPGNQILDEGIGTTWIENLVNASGDFDGDGVLNYDEVSLGTNPFLSDTDGDGLNDGAEILLYFTNATNPDTDGDGLNDSAELFIYLTNATNPDTDGDGLNDGDEIITYATDPTDSDSDDDFMPDGWEVNNSLFPRNPLDNTLDIEGDGLTNLQEFFYNTDPRDFDSDDDGYSDGAEVVAGTDPLDQYDFPTTSTQGPDITLIWVSILIVGIVVAAAIVIHGLLQRSRPVAPPPPKSAPPAPKKPGKGI